MQPAANVESTKPLHPSDRQQKTACLHLHVFTLRPPVFSLMGVRKGSKIMWLVSMLTGDCLFPTEHRFQAELTSPQKDGTATQKTEWVFKRVSACTNEIGARSTKRSHCLCLSRYLNADLPDSKGEKFN